MAAARKRINDIIPLKNRLILASSPLGSSVRSICDFSRVAGAVVTKSITVQPRAGNPQPRRAYLGPYGMINADGAPNPGYKRFATIIREAKKMSKSPLIASLGPMSTTEEMLIVGEEMERAGADAIEVDFKWDYDEASGRVDYERSFIYRAISELKTRIAIPVIAKLSPCVKDIKCDAKAAEDAGVDAISAINTVFPAMKIDIAKRRPSIANLFGGLSGKSIFPIAVASVFQVYSAVNIPVIGIGGVEKGEDVVEMVMAGAGAIEICTAAMREGKSAFVRILGEAEKVLGKLGYSILEECCGIAHKG